MRVYVSEDTHFSSRKVAGLLGLGEANVVVVWTDWQCRMDVDDLRRVVCPDEEAEELPLCVVESVGTVSTGAFDPLPGIGAIAKAHNLWFHVDAAYGGFAALAPSARALLRGIEAADSVTPDPHRWAYLPTGVGCVLYRDGAGARKAFVHDADYTRVIGH